MGPGRQPASSAGWKRLSPFVSLLFNQETTFPVIIISSLPWQANPCINKLKII